MDDLEVLEAKYTFFDNLLKYKMEMESYVELVNYIRQKIDEYLEQPFNITEFSHMKFNDISNMLSNKLVSLVGTFNRKNINLFYFEDREDHSLYVSNFFCGNIIRYYRAYFLDIADTLNTFTLLIAKLDTRLKTIMKRHYFRSLASMFIVGEFYTKDKECMKLIEQIKAQYKIYKDLESKFYLIELKEEYVNIVKYNLEVNYEVHPEKNLNAEELATLYEIDCDFCRTFGCENLIPAITSLYQSYFLKKGFDCNFIIDKGEHYFTTKEDSEFNPKEYITMKIGEISRHKVYYERLKNEYVSALEEDETVGSEGPKKDLK